MYIEFKAGEEVYKLRLNTKGLIELEKDLGYNPIQLFGVGDVPITPTLEDMMKVFKAALKPYHDIKEDEVYKIFDNWLDDDHIITDFIKVIIDIYKASGLLKTEKN
jgi:hypothetical protein